MFRPNRWVGEPFISPRWTVPSGTRQLPPKDWRVASFNDEKTPACYDSGGLLCAGLMAWLSLTRSYFRITKLDGIPDRQLYVS